MSTKSEAGRSTNKMANVDLGLTCAICFEIYRVPKLLGCSHTFCELCIETYLTKLKDDHKLNQGFECPVCRVKTSVDVEADLVQWTKDLPINFALQAVIEAFEDKSKETSGLNITCEGCSKIGKTSVVEMFCVQCNEYQCTNCAEHHMRFSTTSGHVIVGTAGTNIGNASSLSRKIAQYSKCDEHNKKLKFFCTDHKALCCSTCVVILHRQCQKLEDIDSISHKRCQQDASALRRKTAKMQEKVSILSAFCKKQESDIEAQIPHISASLDSALQSIVNLFQKEKERIIDEAVEAKEHQIVKLKRNVMLFKAIEDKLDEIDSILEAFKQTGPKKNSFAVTYRLTKVFENQKNDLSNMLSDVSITHFKLQLANSVPIHLENKPNIAQLEVSTTCVEPDNVPDYRFQLKRMVSTVLSDERKCPRITGITHLLDGRLVAVDNGRSLCIIMDCSHEILSSICLESVPFDIDSDQNDNIAITNGKLKTIEFFKVTGENTLVWVSTVKTPFPCDSVSYFGEKELVIGTFHGSKPVCIINRDGHVTDIAAHFPERKYNLGETKCSYHSETGKLVVSACYDNTIQVINVKTGEESVVRNTKFSGPRGIAITNSGIVFVCSQSNDTIIKLSPAGKEITSHVLQNMKGPFCMSVSKDDTKLTVVNKVTQKTQKSIDIHTYRLELN